jgi:ComF family protein
LAKLEPAKAILTETDVLVPVPLHIFRHISRGFNQAEIIARTVGRACGIRVAKPIVRVRRTPMQTRMPSPTKREENMRGAFELVDDKSICDKNVVLIDDVMTTGATLQAAARAVAKGKPATMCAMTLALADPKHRDFQAI